MHKRVLVTPWVLYVLSFSLVKHTVSAGKNHFFIYVTYIYLVKDQCIKYTLLTQDKIPENLLARANKKGYIRSTQNLDLTCNCSHYDNTMILHGPLRQFFNFNIVKSIYLIKTRY